MTSTPNICAGPFGAIYDLNIERPWLMQLLGRAVWGIDARPLYAAMAPIERLEGGERVIDVPCGGGVALRALSPGQPIEFLAGDIDPVMVERTRRRAAARGLEQVQTGPADLEAPPYRTRAPTCLRPSAACTCSPTLPARCGRSRAA